MNEMIIALQLAYPEVTFVNGNQFSWSAQTKTITYKQTNNISDAWSLLHEVGHAILEHSDFETDIGLLLKESAAWEVAQQLAIERKTVMPQDYIDDCLDSYRDWLNKRSTCPHCGSQGLQTSIGIYTCINCNQLWYVTQNRLCRPYRKK